MMATPLVVEFAATVSLTLSPSLKEMSLLLKGTARAGYHSYQAIYAKTMGQICCGYMV